MVVDGILGKDRVLLGSCSLDSSAVQNRAGFILGNLLGRSYELGYASVLLEPITMVSTLQASLCTIRVCKD